MTNTAPSFGQPGTGFVTTAIGSSSDYDNSVTLQADGKIIVAGTSNSDFALVRYNPDGTLDTSFSGYGILTTDFGSYYNDEGKSVTLQPDGKIIVAGWSGSEDNGSNEDFALARYNTDGSLDTSFSGDGKLTTDFGSSEDKGNSVTLQPDGKIIVAGYSGTYPNSDFAMARYNTDGSLDTSFSGDGKLTTDFGSSEDEGNSVTLQSDGKIIVAGTSNYDFALARYNTDGSLDTSFSGDGKLTTDIESSYDYGYSVTQQSDGKIIVTGYNSNNDFTLVRYLPNGTLDTSFSGDGKRTTDFGSYSNDQGYSVTVQPDGKIIVAGTSYSYSSNSDFALVRYLPNGTLDTSFSGDGKLTTAIGSSEDRGNSVTVQSDGKIIIAGYSQNNIYNNDFALARYLPDGTLDPMFNPPPQSLYGTATYTEGGAVVVLDSDVNLRDAELDAANNYAGATLTLARHGGASAEDRFGTTGGLYFFSNIILLDNVKLGSVAASGGTLTLTFNASATSSLVDRVLQNLTYSNTSIKPPAAVQIDWTFTDGTSAEAQSVTAWTEVKIIPVNSVPLGAPTAVLAAGREDTPYLIKAADLLQGFRDLENEPLTVINLSATHGTLVNNKDGTWTFRLEQNYSGTVNLNYQVSDGQGGKIAAQQSFNMTAVNEPPQFSQLDGVTLGKAHPDGVVLLDGDVKISDPELDAANNYSGARLTLARQGGANSVDQFDGSGTLSFAGGNVVVDSVTIGTVNQNAGTLILTFNASATSALVDNVLQQIAYSRTTTELGAVQIEWIFKEGSGPKALSVSGSTTVIPNDRFEENDSAATATDIGNIGNILYAADNLNIQFNDPDWYRFHLENTGTAQTLARIDFDVRQGDLDFYLYDSSGTQLLNGSINEGTNREEMSLESFPAGDYLLKVEGYNYAANPNYRLTVGNPQAVNEAPTISDASVTLAENSAAGILVTTVIGSDPNGDALTYQISSGNTDIDGDGQGAFAINSPTGAITVNDAGDVNYERQKVFTLGITATDPKGLTGNGKISVNLTDVFEIGPGVTITPNSGTTSELGSTAQFSVTLNTQPVQEVKIAFTSTNSAEGKVLNPQLIFTAANWNVAQTLTIQGVDDAPKDIVDANTAYQITGVVTSSDIDYIRGITVPEIGLINQDDPLDQPISWTGDSGRNEKHGGHGNDVLSGEGEIDFLYGERGDDRLNGGNDDDQLFGEDGNDRLNGDNGFDTLDGGTGNDILSGGNDDDSLMGADGDDQLNGDNGLDNLNGGAGQDILSGGEQDDQLDGGDGNDKLYGQGGDDNLLGGAGLDTLDGGVGADTMDGGLGNDVYYLDDPADTVKDSGPVTDIDTLIIPATLTYTLGASLENATLNGSGNGKLIGNIGRNTLTGNSGNNVLDGGAGNDTLIGGAGNDTLKGGTGIDTANYAAIKTPITANLATGKVTGDGTDIISEIENLLGGAGNDTLTGNSSGNNLTGGAGNDKISGGIGKDTLVGSAGADIFIYNAVTESGIGAAARDVIKDFSRAQGDKLDLHLIGAKSFIAGNFSGSAGEVRFDSVNHLVQFDNNGDAKADFEIELTGVTQLSAADFIF